MALADQSLRELAEQLPKADREIVMDAISSGDIAKLEEAVFKYMGRIVRIPFVRHLQQMVDDVDDRQPVRCPVCGKELRPWRTRDRKLQGVLGDIELRRREYRCCGQLHVPADRALGLRSDARQTPWREQLAEEFGTESISFEAARRLMVLSFPSVPSSTTIGAVVHRVGADAIAAQDRRNKDARRAPRQSPRIPQSARHDDTIVIEVDGGMAPCRDGWREAKAGGVYLTRDRVEKPPPRPGEPGRGRVRRSLATARIGHWDRDFAPSVWELAVRAGLREAGHAVLLGDGAEWIDLLHREYFPHATRILDFWHALEHVCEPARIAFDGDERAFGEWRSRQTERLLSGRLDSVLAAIRWLSRRGKLAGLDDCIRRTVTYLQKRSKQMDYPRFRKQGFPIGSGLIEGRIKTLIRARVCGPGMRWSEAGCNAVLQLRADRRNSRSLAA